MKKLRYELIDTYSLLAILPKRHRQQQQQKKSEIQKAGLVGAALKILKSQKTKLLKILTLYEIKRRKIQPFLKTFVLNSFNLIGEFKEI